MKKISQFLISFLTALPLAAFAVTVGEISQVVTSIMGEVSTLANVIAFITGAAFCISSLIKFQEYRRSPQNMPISRPITELVVGIILFCLPLIFSETAQNAVFGKG